MNLGEKIWNWASTKKIYMRLKMPCGNGKSFMTVNHFIIPYIKMAKLKNDKVRFVIGVPDHKMAVGVDNIEGWLDDGGINYTHFYGKTTKDNVLCLHPSKAYVPGCKKCVDYDKCPYQSQNKEADVIITAMENLDMFGELSDCPTILYLDESPERIFMQEYTIPNSSLLECSKSPYIITEGGNRYEFLTGIKLKDKFVVKTEKDFFLLQFFKNNYNINGHILPSGVINLFGQKRYLIHKNYEKVIFSCATTPLSFMHTMFQTKPEDWEIYETDSSLKNPIIRLKGGFSKNWSMKNIDKLSLFLNEMKKYAPNIMIVTKKEIETGLISNGINWCEYVHYGSGRGSNKWNKDYDLVIVYSRFGLRPQEHIKYRMMGVFEKTLKDLEVSEVEQCLSRCRPMQHPQTPILLMTNREYLIGEEHIDVPKTVVDDFITYPLVTVKPDISEIMSKLVIGKNRAYAFKSFLEFIWTFVMKMPSLYEQIHEYSRKHTLKETAEFFEVSEKTARKHIIKKTKMRRDNRDKNI